jgi:ABC-2 type transport system permease protein
MMFSLSWFREKNKMGRIFRSIIRASAFLRKEIFVILRQPRLVFTLVLGPFLILLIFGIGYRAVAPPLRTLFVVHEGSPLIDQIEEYASSLGDQLVYMGVTHDGALALELLNQGEVDVVAVTPANASETIQNNEPAVFILYHREIDPFQVDYVNYFGQVYVDEVNRRVLREMAVQGQQDASDVTEDVQAARASASAMRAALERDDSQSAQLQQRELGQRLDNVSLVVGATLGILSGVEQTLGGEENAQAGDMLSTLTELRQDSQELEDDPSRASQLERVQRIEDGLIRLEENLIQFQRVDPNVLVSPFRSEIRGIAPLQPTAPDFFAPAVIALLMQHLAVTFAALSIVSERSVGTMELFRVSPLSALEALLGKYLSYMIFGAVISTALTLLLVYVLRMPMLGSWVHYTLVVAVLLFTSLSIGFLISIFSQNESQAVQYTMIVLLASVFFSGFLMDLSMIWEPVRVVSWALPTTYGIVLLRDIMLRGIQPDLFLLVGLLAIGVVLFLLSAFALRNLISRSR